MGEVTITLPWPPSKTSPNKSNSGNWWEKSTAAKSYKETCGKECMAQGVRKMGCTDVTVTVTYHPPTNGRIDWDNMANRCKQGFDAISEAIGVDDGNWWPVVSEKGDKVKGGCVLVHIKPCGVTAIPIVGYIGEAT